MLSTSEVSCAVMAPPSSQGLARLPPARPDAFQQHVGVAGCSLDSGTACQLRPWAMPASEICLRDCKAAPHCPSRSFRPCDEDPSGKIHLGRSVMVTMVTMICVAVNPHISDFSRRPLTICSSLSCLPEIT